MSEAALLTLSVATVVAVDRHRLHLALGIVVALVAGRGALASNLLRAAGRATHLIIVRGLPLAENQLFEPQQPGQRFVRR